MSFPEFFFILITQDNLKWRKFPIWHWIKIWFLIRHYKILSSLFDTRITCRLYLLETSINFTFNMSDIWYVDQNTPDIQQIFIFSLNNYITKVVEIGKHNVQLYIALWIIHRKLFNSVVVYSIYFIIYNKNFCTR